MGYVGLPLAMEFAKQYPTIGFDINLKRIKELKFPREAVFGGIIRDGKALMSYGDFQIESGDKAIVFCLPEAIHIVEDLFR